MADKEKERRYLQKRRASGGDECGVIQKVSGNSYETRFKDKEDQERVLQTKDHTISLPGGEVRLTVSSINPTETPDQPKASHSQIFTKTNSKSLEKIYHLDVFLLRYMTDNPKAFTYLQKQLSSISCEVDLNCEEEKAVVRGDVERGSGGAFRGDTEKWEQQVNQIIVTITEEYDCYHVVEAKQVQVLLQDLSFVNEDIKVYRESGYPVIVGKAGAVKERVAILTKSLPIRKEKPITENQLKLIEHEFCHELRAHYPDVQLSRGKGIIVLEGLEDEVQSGATKLDELIGQIKERNIQFPTPLLNFINLSGAISKYQARFFRNPVSIEMRPDLVLSSLSADALDEVQEALVKDLTVSTIQLEGAAAVSPHLDKLKDILNQAQSKANRDELRVDVSFIPGINGAKKVRLVGYSANVLQFKDFIQNYQLNQVMSQDTVNLSNPEFAECFDKILDLTGIKSPNVTFKVSPLPNPCVILSGPHCKVQEAKQALLSALASLTSDTLVLEGSGAQRYYQTTGKDSNELVEHSFRIIIREQRSVGGTATTHNVSSPINKANVAIKLGSLEDEQVNVLVVPMVNIRLTSTKIGNCLLKKAGNALKSKFDSLALNCRLAPGDILQVDGPPSLGCSKIFFIECLPWDGVGGMSVQALGRGLRQCLDLCTLQGLSSLAFPIIGPGILLKYPLDTALEVLTEALYGFGSSVSSSSLSTINIIIKPQDSEDVLFLTFEEHLQQIFPHSVMHSESFLQHRDVQREQPPEFIPGHSSSSFTGEQCVFLFLGLCRKDVDDAMNKVKDLYQAHCSTKTFPKKDLEYLTEADVTALQELLKTEALHVQEDDQGGLTVSGLKVGVNKVVQMLETTIPLRREMKLKEEENLYALVTWCILDLYGQWEELPKAARHALERGDVAKGIVDKQGHQWSMDLQRMEATRNGRTTMLKRLENRADLILPLYWDNMSTGENLKVVPLQPSSTEYRTVLYSFKRTANNTVIKIERLQNVHLRRTYRVQKQYVSEKNKGQGTIERRLFHGTSPETCGSIMNHGFNRSFSGKNGTALGHGTYFAVNASYSVSFASPGADGSQTMFLARVLTGCYTQGNSSMRCPPSRSSHDLYDSVVDRTDNPSMFVVFNDNQAYPDYLITFTSSS
ncbi:protein mono-ADP-ribosyltransferase PARP14-like isoform X2 [Salarias fasciatus]|uniref:protein mono-ADP-ribosyltransferase PARP14-like isoform X2 n=1 Tax=Salarias fasciatus TaxID=181472 RepID=UPI001176CE76|nr:protein mono-ADP-ribosyltransferase PARP14-like isoform X2 [Salarias fasciatus]